MEIKASPMSISSHERLNSPTGVLPNASIWRARITSSKPRMFSKENVNILMFAGMSRIATRIKINPNMKLSATTVGMCVSRKRKKLPFLLVLASYGSEDEAVISSGEFNLVTFWRHHAR